MLKGCSRGFSMIEVLIALVIMSGVVVMVLSSIATGAKSVGTLDELSTAENIAQAQLEYTKSATYDPVPAAYDAIPTLPPDYTVTVEAYVVTGAGEGSPRDEMQKIVVSVYHQGEAVFFKEGYKVDR